MVSLRDLGLSEYEARAFRSLLETGPTTAKDLSRTSDVPMGRIYDVLGSLEAYDVVRSQSASRPKKYVAVEPETALDRLLADKKRQLAEEESRYEEIVDTLEDRLESETPADDPFWTAALGPEETGDLLVERLAASEDRIVVVGSSPTPQFDLDDVGERILGELERALDRGVRIQILLRPSVVDTLPESVGRRYRSTLQNEGDVRVRTSPNISGTFELIDDVEVCIEVPNPLNATGDAFAVIDLTDPDFAASVDEAFRERWEAAEPLDL